MLPKIFLILFLVFDTGTLTQTAFAVTPPKGESSNIRHISQPFSRTYLSLELGRNYPLSFSQNQFEAGPLHPILGYRFALDSSWIMGIGTQFKILSKKARVDSREIALWTIYHEAMFTVRLDHPNYLLIGPKLLYLLPAKVATVPLQRDDNFAVEIGAGISVGLAHLADPWLFTLRVDRWRGTTTTRLQGLEIALGVSFSLEDK